MKKNNFLFNTGKLNIYVKCVEDYCVIFVVYFCLTFDISNNVFTQ